MAFPNNVVSGENTTLACENQVGSLNSTSSTPQQNGTINKALAPYVAPTLPIGTWQITGINPDTCAVNEQLNQQTYVAESLNITGAPINIYPLLGVHQQGNGSILSSGMVIGSQSAPGYPLTGINGGAGWRSIQTGTLVAGSGCYVGVDFGIKLLTHDGNQSEYEPQAQKWTSIGCVLLTQSNNPGYFAQQVKVDLATSDCTIAPPLAGTMNAGNGLVTELSVGSNVTYGTVVLQAMTSTTFNCYAQLPSNTVISLGPATIGVPFFSTFINFTINSGTLPFVGGDMFTIPVNYEWSRAGVFNVIQSPAPQQLNLQTPILCKAIRITPTMFTGVNSWEVDAIDVLDSVPSNINNIQDLFFNENRDRDYNTMPIMLKCAYTPADSISDLAKYGLSILDQYVFTVAFATMVKLIGRPVVTGDIIEVIPEMQYDQNLLPIRKFLEVTDTGWSSAGFGPAYNPTVYRFTAQQALPSQETRDIFGTMDTEKYLMGDALFQNGIGQQIDTTPLTRTEEISKAAANAVPETGSDDNRSIEGIVLQQPLPPINAKGQPPAASNPSPGSGPNLYIEDALPPNGAAYGEGFVLPTIPGPADGAYFRLNYVPEMQIPARLYRFSMVKNAWIYQETDRRGQYSSIKPSVRSIMQSSTSVPMSKKQT